MPRFWFLNHSGCSATRCGRSGTEPHSALRAALSPNPSPASGRGELLLWLFAVRAPSEAPGGVPRAAGCETGRRASVVRTGTSCRRAPRARRPTRGPLAKRAARCPFFWCLFFGQAKKRHPPPGGGGTRRRGLRKTLDPRRLKAEFQTVVQAIKLRKRANSKPKRCQSASNPGSPNRNPSPSNRRTSIPARPRASAIASASPVGTH